MTAIPLLLVDGHYLLHRAFFGFATRIVTRDKNTDRTGVFGFAALLRKAQAQHATGFEVFVAFDAEDGSETRAGQDSEYKAQRPAPEPGLMESLTLIKDVLDQAGIRWIEQNGCEADDVIATLTTRARSAGRPVDIMSTDKDYIQLLADPAVRLLNTGLAADHRYTVGEHIRPRYGVLADQWPDYRALTGDPRRQYRRHPGHRAQDRRRPPGRRTTTGTQPCHGAAPRLGRAVAPGPALARNDQARHEGGPP